MATLPHDTPAALRVPSTELIEVESRFEEGITWRRAGSGLLECRSHALRDDEGRVWVIDPLDGEGLDDELANLGTVAGVIMLLDRHVRASPQIAARHGVPLHVPEGRWRRGNPMPDGASPFGATIPGCPFQLPVVVQRDGQWLERALWWPQHLLLIVSEAVGSPAYYKSRLQEPMGVHPVLRVTGPPRRLLAIEPAPQRILFGHGPSVHTDAAAHLELAVTEARRELPSFVIASTRHAVRFARAAIGIGRASC